MPMAETASLATRAALVEPKVVPEALERKKNPMDARPEVAPPFDIPPPTLNGG